MLMQIIICLIAVAPYVVGAILIGIFIAIIRKK